MATPPGNRRLPRQFEQLTTPRALAAIGAAVAVIVAVVVVVVSVRSSSTAGPGGAGAPSSGPGSGAGVPGPTASKNPGNNLTGAERSRYCRAYDNLPVKAAEDLDEDGGADLPQLARTFAALEKNYTAAQKVAPVGLVADYSTVLGYLRTSQQAVRSKDVDQIKVMVTNLGTLNDYMSNIQSTSQRLCD